MAISSKLQTLYTSEVDVTWFEVLIISHSQFTKTYNITNAYGTKQGYVNGSLITFENIPFELSLPKRDAAGRSDLTLAIGVVGNNLTAELDLAIEKPEERIKLQYTVYINGDLNMQYDPPLELSLTNIEANTQQMTGQATQADTLNAPFPRLVYRPEPFPGLVRR